MVIEGSIHFHLCSLHTVFKFYSISETELTTIVNFSCVYTEYWVFDMAPKGMMQCIVTPTAQGCLMSSFLHESALTVVLFQLKLFKFCASLILSYCASIPCSLFRLHTLFLFRLPTLFVSPLHPVFASPPQPFLCFCPRTLLFHREHSRVISTHR